MGLGRGGSYTYIQLADVKPVIMYLQIWGYISFNLFQHLTLFFFNNHHNDQNNLYIDLCGLQDFKGTVLSRVLACGYYKALGRKYFRLCRACSLYCRYSSLWLQQESSPRNARAGLCARKPLQYQVMVCVCRAPLIQMTWGK